MATGAIRQTAGVRGLASGVAVLTALLLITLSMRAIAREEPPPVNAAPGCVPINRYVAPGETVDILTPCYQEDSDYRLLTLSIDSAPTQGAVSVVDYAHVRYTANAAAAGTDTFTMRATDSLGAISDAAAITITFAANNSPNCPSFAGHTTPGGVTANQVSCADPDGDFLTAVTIVTQPTQGTLVAQAAPSVDYLHYGDVSFYYTAAANASGTDSFTYTVTDQRGGTSLPVIGTIGFANQPPTASSGSTNLLPGEARTFLPCNVDSDGDLLTVLVVSPPVKGSVTVGPPALVPQIQYIANVGASGSDTFTARCDDGHGGVSSIATFNVVINASNSAPVCVHNNQVTLNSDPRLVDAGAAVAIDVSCIDPDHGYPFSYAVASSPSKGTVSVVNSPGSGFGAFRYTANAGESGADAFTFTGTDPLGAVSAPATVNITIAQCTPTSHRYRHTMQVWYGSAFEGTTKLRDGVQLSDFITAGIGSSIRLDPALDARVFDALSNPYPWVNPIGLTNIEWVLESPQNRPAETTLRAGLAAGLSAPVFDSIVNRGTRSFQVDQFEQQESCNQSGDLHDVPVEFVVEVSFVELNVREGNRAPACVNRTGNVNAGAAVDIAPSCTDADSNPLTYAIGSQGTKGTASIVGGQLHYAANAGTSGSDTFTYTANDGNGGLSNSATVTIAITGTSTCQYGAQGCTTGYWKTNAEKRAANAWPAGFTPTTKISQVFNVPGCVDAALGNATLLQALGFGSGKTLMLAAQNLLRQAVGSVLNASNTCIKFGACAGDVVTRTNAALASCSRGPITDLARQLEALNSMSCPLDARGICLIPR